MPPSAAVGKSTRPPKWIKPQLTRLVDEAPAGDGWLHEIKYDGYRMLCCGSSGARGADPSRQCRLGARSGRPAAPGRELTGTSIEFVMMPLALARLPESFFESH